VLRLLLRDTRRIPFKFSRAAAVGLNMRRRSLFRGLVVGSGAMLGLAIAASRGDSGTGRAQVTRPSAAVASSTTAREYRVVSGRVDGKLAFLPEQSGPAESVEAAQQVGTEDSERRIVRNEIAIIASLRNLQSAQAQFQEAARADENYNGVGEYGSEVRPPPARMARTATSGHALASL